MKPGDQAPVLDAELVEALRAATIEFTAAIEKATVALNGFVTAFVGDDDE